MRQQDWQPADIIAALKKRGTSLTAVSRNAGLASSTLTNALNRRRPKGERLIAEALASHLSKSGLRAIADVPPAQPGYGSRAAFYLSDSP
ncbi:Ner winged helix-turn-helix DNA-binding domain-containing protein [Klebsiella pneumoniae]